MVRTEVQLTDEQDRQLERLASTLRLSKGDLISQAIELLFRQHAVHVPSAEQWQRALTIIGSFRSGAHDTAREHDKYLADAYGPPRE